MKLALLIPFIYAILLPPPTFKVHCPRCTTQLVQAPLTITTNKVEDVLEGKFVYREMTFKCPKCSVVFKAKSKTLLADVVAEEVPFAIHRSALLPDPLILPKISPVPGTSNLFLISLQPGTKISHQPLTAMSVEALSGLYNTNAAKVMLLIIEKE